MRQAERVKWILGFWLFFLCAPSLLAVGTITAATGTVSIERESQSLAAASGFALKEHDIVHTGEDARAQLRFADGTVITMGRNAELNIETFLYDEANAADSQVRFGAAKGALRAVTGQVGRANPDRFQMQTRTATIGIRGTQVLMSIQPEDETIACTEGVIVVEAEGQSVEVSAGQLTRTRMGQPPTPPVAYTPEEVESLASEAGGGGEVIDPDEVVIEEESDESIEPAEATEEETAEEEATEEEAIEEEATEEEAASEETIASEEASEEEDLALGTTSEEASEEEEIAFREIESEPEEIDPVELPDTREYSEDLAESTVAAVTAEESTEELISAEEIQEAAPDQPIETPTAHRMELSGDDPYTSWGFWVSTPTDNPAPDQIVEGYVSGDLTPESTVAHLMEIGSVYGYSGSVEGTVDQAHRMQNGQFDMNIHFGSSNPIRGDIRFDAGGEHWHIGVSGGAIAGSGYHTEGLSAGGDSSVSIESGRLDGRLYGPGAESTGGSFSASGSGGTAEGIFKGRR